MRVFPVTNYSLAKTNEIVKPCPPCKVPAFKGKGGAAIGAAGGTIWGVFAGACLAPFVAAAAPFVIGAAAVGAVSGHLIENEIKRDTKDDNKNK